MKRTAIQLASNTLVVSLPAKWVFRNKIKKGDELEIQERSSSVTISKAGAKTKAKVLLDSRGLSERALRWAFSSLHKQGYSEIAVVYDHPSVLRLAEELVRDLYMGFAIVAQKEKVFTIQQVAFDSEESLDTVMRRAFLVTVSLAEGVADAVKSWDMEGLRRVILLEKANNQMTNFCMRLINQGDVENAVFKFEIMFNLEKIADEYKYLGNQISGKVNLKKRAPLVTETASLVRGYYACLYDGDLRMLSALAGKRVHLDEKIHQALRHAKGEDADVLFHLRVIVSKLGDFSASFIAVRKMIT